MVKGIYADFLNAWAVENEWTWRWVEGTFAEGLERLNGARSNHDGRRMTEQRQDGSISPLRLSPLGVNYSRRGMTADRSDLEG